MPKVSIILPTYNGEKYLKQSVNSIINQTFTDWELIIVNDCSNDNTVNIVNDYAELDERIKVIHNKENQKLPSSLNIGFKQATGDYFTWTSDDNIFEKEAIGKMVSFLDINKLIPMVRTDMSIIDDNSKIVGYSDKFNNRKMFINNYVGACFMYRKEVAHKIGGYNKDLFCVEDYDYWIRVMEEFGDIGNIQEVLYRYRNHQESLSNTKKDMVESQLIKMRKIHIDFLISNMKGDDKKEFDLYNILLNCGYEKEDIHKIISEQNLLINYDKYIDKNKKVVVYGAGYYGKKVFELLDGNIEFYIDKNDELIGKEKNGIKIKRINEYISEMKNYNLVVALSIENTYYAINELFDLGIREYTTYALLENQLRKGHLL